MAGNEQHLSHGNHSDPFATWNLVDFENLNLIGILHGNHFSGAQAKVLLLQELPLLCRLAPRPLLQEQQITIWFIFNQQFINQSVYIQNDLSGL